MTTAEKIAVWAIVILEWARNFYIKAFPLASFFLVLGFVGGIECNTINGANAFPIAITYTICALIFIICVLLQNAEKKKYRPRHVRRGR